MAKLVRSGYNYDSLKLTDSDLALLVMGVTLSVDGLLIGLNRQPDNGCDCDYCAEVFADQRIAGTERLQ